MSKLKDIDILIGSTIKSYNQTSEKSLVIVTEDKIYQVLVDDDGYGCNDSHAYFSEISLDNIVNKKIVKAFHGGMDSYGVILTIETENETGLIEITHEHNGYYGFSYEIVETKR